jgi:hypothetical protein
MSDNKNVEGTEDAQQSEEKEIVPEVSFDLGTITIQFNSCIT